MRLLSISAATTLMLTLFGATAHADWCASYRSGGNNCGFHTYQQCMAAVSGNGGFCNTSPYSSSQTSERPRRAANVATHVRRREVEQESKRERVRQARAKPVRQFAKRHVPSEEPVQNRGARLSPGDDDHIIPAEPE
jgi:Protein of unknown function (DUF3551)